MHSNPVDLTVDCNQSVPAGADAKKIVEPTEPAAESVSNSNTDVNGKEDQEEWGDERERECYLLGQEHDSWDVREREAGEWPIWVDPEDEKEVGH